MKKITALKLIALAGLMTLAGKAQASGFDLESLNAADIRASQAAIKAPAPQLEADELMGVDMNIRIPFKALKKAIDGVGGIAVVAKDAPVFTKVGEFMRVGNILVDVGGIKLTPVLTLRPYMDGRDTLAIRIQRVQLHASMAPTLTKAQSASDPALDMESVMADVVGAITKSIHESLNETLKKKKVAMTAEQALIFKYDKAAWTLRATVSPRLIGMEIPEGMINPLHLTGFSFNEAGVTLKIQTLE
jgi:hypothetical protein